MAKKDKPSNQNDEFSEDWELSEETEDGKKEFNISNNLLWVLFVVILAIFIIVPFMLGNNSNKDLQTTTVNGIPIISEGEPISALQNLKNLHIEGKRDDTIDSNDALNEILVVIGQSSTGTSGGTYTLYAGLGDKTEIRFVGKVIEITGTDIQEFWEAIWTLDSIISETEIDSDVNLYDVQNKLSKKKTVYLVQNMDNVCGPYSRIITAEGDILSSLGFKQSKYGFDIKHYQKKNGVCNPFDNLTEEVDCPTSAEGVFIITMQRGDSNKITIKGNEITFEYVDCATVNHVSVILRDLLFPNIVSALSGVKFPMDAI